MIGQSVGGYRIVAKLGAGGMGVVYRAEHRRIARQAAIKVLRPDLAGKTEMLERFFNEARATSMIRHPGIVEIYDCDVLPRGDAFIVMELLAGETLAAALSRGPVGPARGIALAREAADALAAAHARGIVHRDLKPDNIFLVSAPGVATETIKIVDFGIAKLTNAALMGGQRMTNTGRMLGTPTYMSPEQCHGARDVDARTDVYALGCILFEMVCGRPPFTGVGFGQLVACHIGVPPPRLAAVEPTAPLALDALVGRMLAKDAAARPQSMSEVIEELDRLGTPRPAARTPAPLPGTMMMFSGPRTLTPVTAPTPTAAPPASSSEAAMRVSSPATRAARFDTKAPPTSEPTEPPHTTLRSAASESMIPVQPPADPAEASGAGWRDGGRGRARGLESRWVGPLVATLAGTALVVTGYAVLHGRSDRSTTAEASAPAVVERPPRAVAGEATPEPTGDPRPDPSLEPPRPMGASALPRRPVDTNPRTEQSIAAAGAAVSPPAPETVTITITSKPSQADVCFARNDLLIGRTGFDWHPERSGKAAKLWVRKPGYRGREITVSLDHDSKTHVELNELGPDDIADVESCHR